MQIQTMLAIALILPIATFAADEPQTYAEALNVWQRNQSSVEYQNYLTAFTQFNNHFHLDEKDGCYSLGPGTVRLMLIITHPDNSEFALVQRVLSDVNTPKAQCFKSSYTGLRTKIPPFFPFVLQMDMG